MGKACESRGSAWSIVAARGDTGSAWPAVKRFGPSCPRLFRPSLHWCSRRRAGTALRVHRVLSHRPLQSIGDVANTLDLSYPAVSNSLQALAGLGIVREITGRQRNRIYAYQGFLDILNEGSQPL